MGANRWMLDKSVRGTLRSLVCIVLALPMEHYTIWTRTGWYFAVFVSAFYIFGTKNQAKIPNSGTVLQSTLGSVAYGGCAHLLQRKNDKMRRAVLFQIFSHCVSRDLLLGLAGLWPVPGQSQGGI